MNVNKHRQHQTLSWMFLICPFLNKVYKLSLVIFILFYLFWLLASIPFRTCCTLPRSLIVVFIHQVDEEGRKEVDELYSVGTWTPLLFDLKFKIIYLFIYLFFFFNEILIPTLLCASSTFSTYMKSKLHGKECVCELVCLHLVDLIPVWSHLLWNHSTFEHSLNMKKEEEE